MISIVYVDDIKRKYVIESKIHQKTFQAKMNVSDFRDYVIHNANNASDNNWNVRVFFLFFRMWLRLNFVAILIENELSTEKNTIHAMDSVECKCSFESDSLWEKE